MGVSESGESGAGAVSIFYLSAMLIIFPFKNISVSSFSPDDSKWSSGAMLEVAAAAVVAAREEKTAASGVA